MASPIIAIHGGAGGLRRDTVPAEYEDAARRALESSLAMGYELLERGSSAVTAAIAAVVVLENCPLFNAGRGSVLRSDGTVAMDAAVMDGASGRAGAVAGLTQAANPVMVARDVMLRTDHVLLVGSRADAFAQEQGHAAESLDYFITPHRAEQLERARAKAQTALDHDLPSSTTGTVGAVVRDAHGHLAAATSTGGMTNAHPGRVGDSPILGAGTWANDGTCAVSATGHGEPFMRTAVAHEIDAGMRLGGLDLEQACIAALERARDAGGIGGCIAVDSAGTVALPFTANAMPRGVMGEDGVARVAIFEDQTLD